VASITKQKIYDLTYRWFLNHKFQSFDVVVKGKKERERAELNFVETVGMGNISFDHFGPVESTANLNHFDTALAGCLGFIYFGVGGRTQLNTRTKYSAESRVESYYSTLNLRSR
jgi:hypothetical protein